MKGNKIGKWISSIFLILLSPSSVCCQLPFCVCWKVRFVWKGGNNSSSSRAGAPIGAVQVYYPLPPPPPPTPPTPPPTPAVQLYSPPNHYPPSLFQPPTWISLVVQIWILKWNFFASFTELPSCFNLSGFCRNFKIVKLWLFCILAAQCTSKHNKPLQTASVSDLYVRFLFLYWWMFSFL